MLFLDSNYNNNKLVLRQNFCFTTKSNPVSVCAWQKSNVTSVDITRTVDVHTDQVHQEVVILLNVVNNDRVLRMLEHYYKDSSYTASKDALFYNIMNNRNVWVCDGGPGCVAIHVCRIYNDVDNDAAYAQREHEENENAHNANGLVDDDALQNEQYASHVLHDALEAHELMKLVHNDNAGDVLNEMCWCCAENANNYIHWHHEHAVLGTQHEAAGDPYGNYLRPMLRIKADAFAEASNYIWRLTGEFIDFNAIDKTGIAYDDDNDYGSMYVMRVSQKYTVEGTHTAHVDITLKYPLHALFERKVNDELTNVDRTHCMENCMESTRQREYSDVLAAKYNLDSDDKEFIQLKWCQQSLDEANNIIAHNDRVFKRTLFSSKTRNEDFMHTFRNAATVRFTHAIVLEATVHAHFADDILISQFNARDNKLQLEYSNTLPIKLQFTASNIARDAMFISNNQNNVATMYPAYAFCKLLGSSSAYRNELCRRIAQNMEAEDTHAHEHPILLALMLTARDVIDALGAILYSFK